MKKRKQTMSIDILFVTPPSKDRVYQKLGETLSSIEVPVWSMLCATYIRDQGYSVAILDAEADHLSYAQCAITIEAYDPILTVFSVYGQQPSASTQCMPAGAEVCKLLNPQLKTLVMGTHASALPMKTMEEEPYDYVCKGEGPYTILHLLQYLRSGGNIAKVPGLYYREPGHIIGTKMADNIQNLDMELPEQAWDLINIKKYRAHNWHCFPDYKRTPYASIQTSLGCPYKCSFCCINAPFGGAGIRYWKPENVVKQMEMLHIKHGVANIKIPDEMFILNEQHVTAICDLIIEKGLKLNIWAYGRIDTVKPRYLEKLKKAGFNWLALGIESGSKYVRDGSDKGKFKDDDIYEICQQIKDAGINIIANYIFGLPDDTHQSMQETLGMAQEINAEWANFYCAMAYPGSPLYDQTKNSTFHPNALPEEHIGYSQHAYETQPLPTAALTAKEVLAFRDEAFMNYFTDPMYLKMIQEKFGPIVVNDIQSMTKIKLERRLLNE